MTEENNVERDEHNIPLKDRMRANVYPDSAEKLEEDLIKKDQGPSDGMQVKSDDEGLQEWDAREDVQKQQDNNEKH